MFKGKGSIDTSFTAGQNDEEKPSSLVEPNHPRKTPTATSRGARSLIASHCIVRKIQVPGCRTCSTHNACPGCQKGKQIKTDGPPCARPPSTQVQQGGQYPRRRDQRRDRRGPRGGAPRLRPLEGREGGSEGGSEGGLPVEQSVVNSSPRSVRHFQNPVLVRLLQLFVKLLLQGTGP